MLRVHTSSELIKFATAAKSPSAIVDFARITPWARISSVAALRKSSKGTMETAAADPELFPDSSSAGGAIAAIQASDNEFTLGEGFWVSTGNCDGGVVAPLVSAMLVKRFLVNGLASCDKSLCDTTEPNHEMKRVLKYMVAISLRMYLADMSFSGAPPQCTPSCQSWGCRLAPTRVSQPA